MRSVDRHSARDGMLRKLQAICSGVNEEVGVGVAPAVGVPIVVGGFDTG